jgi:hypothetical protein
VTARSLRGRFAPPAVLVLAAGLAVALLAVPASAAPPVPGGSGAELELRSLPSVTALGVTVTATPEAGYVPLVVAFQANVTGTAPGTITVTWQFGDGAIGSGRNTSHTFRTAGRFLISVAVEDSAGDVGNASLPVYTVLPAGGAPSLGLAESIEVVVAGAGTGVLGAFVTYLLLGRRSRPPDLSAVEMSEGAAAPVGPGGPEAAARRADAPSGSDGAPSAPLEPLPDPGYEREDSPTAARRRASDEILLHLGGLGRPSPHEVADPSRTQGGMGERLGIPQNVVSPILRRLAAAGVVAVEVRHVRNGRRRLKVYRLTDRGEAVVRDLRSRGLTGRSRPGRGTPARPG